MKPPSFKDQALEFIHQPRWDISKVLISVIAGFSVFNTAVLCFRIGLVSGCNLVNKGL
jgi:hypothetical protein